MKSKIRLALAIAAAIGMADANAEDVSTNVKGSIKANIFAGYHAGLWHANSQSGFDVDRARLSYEFTASPTLSGKVAFEFGTTKVGSSELERVAHLKYAMLSWKYQQLVVDFGVIGLEQFSLQESFWGYRYIMKSFQDEYKFGNSGDAGILAKYAITPWLSVDGAITNGEGYKHLNNDNKYRYEVGATAHPCSTVAIRVYYDRYSHTAAANKDQEVVSFFAGYKNSAFSLGAEYNLMLNTKFTPHHNQNGYSIYGSVCLNSHFNLFARFDELHSENRWNAASDGQHWLTGVQYAPWTYLKLAPNFSAWNPHHGKTLPVVALNIDFKI